MGKTSLGTSGGRSGPGFKLSVLGGFTLLDHTGAQVEISTKKVRAIIAYLLLEGGRPVSRERLAGILWSDRSEDYARQSLRQALMKMRLLFDKVEFQNYEIGREEIRIDLQFATIDLFDLDAALVDGKVPHAAITESNQPDRILYGMESLDQLYHSWIQQTRHQWRERYASSLQKLVDCTDPETCRTAADALIQIDPTHEPAHRRLMRYHADLGNDPAAERQYKLLWDKLDEYGAEPDSATQQLVAQIKLGHYRTHDDATTLSTRPLPTETGLSDGILQLPFIYVHKFKSVVPDQETFATGLRLEFISNLVRFRDWTVLDATTDSLNQGYVNADGGQNSPIGAFSIEGTIYEPYDEKVIVITLKDQHSGAYLWSERVSVDAENWFQAQRRITVQIASSLNKHLTAKLAAKKFAVHAIESDAYFRWLDSHHKIWSFDPLVRAEVEQTLREIVEQYPSFAPAYTGLVLVIDTKHLVLPGELPDLERLKEGAIQADRAITLDPLDARNVVNSAWSSAMIGQFHKAEANFRQARELNPNNPMSAISSANGLSMCGDLETGYRWSKESIDQLPVITPVQWGFLTSTFFLCGKYEESIIAADNAGNIMPTVPGFLAIAKAMNGDKEGGLEAADRFFELCCSNWQGKTDPTREAVGQWFLAHCPIGKSQLRTKLETGLREVNLLA